MHNPDPPTSPAPPPGSHKDAKAQAKAASAYAKAQRPWFKKKRFILGGLLALLIVGAAIGSGGSDDETAGGSGEGSNAASDTDNAASDTDNAASDTDNAASDTNDSGEDVYAIGQTGKSSDLEITVVSVEDPWTSDNQFITPDAGRRYIAVEMNLLNTGDRTDTFSEHFAIEVTDAEGRAGDVSFMVSDQPSIGGDIPAGTTRSGWTYLEVAEDSTGVTMRVKGSFTASGTLFALD